MWMFECIALMVIVSGVSCGAVIWTDLTQLRMAQTTIYDNVYIPVNTNSFVDITYLTPFPTGFSNASVISALVLSGFQNYLQCQMIMNVTIYSLDQTKLIANIWVGAQTFVKQMRVNYFVVQTNAGSLYQHIHVSIGNYRTLDLDDANGPRFQYFAVEGSPFAYAVGICSAIHGFEYSNTEGMINQIDVNTSLINTTSNLITHNITVGQKGRLNYISITTILIGPGFYPNPNPYLTLGGTFQTTIRNDLSGLDMFNYMSNGGLFASTQNSLFFGMSSFNFTMQGSRLLILNIATNSNFSKNLITNNFMKYTVISVMVIVNRVCNTTSDFFYVEGYVCVPSSQCALLYMDSTNKICKNCLSTCSGCTASEGDCKNCTAGTHRVVVAGTLPSTCQCDYNSGYVQVNKKDICQLCSSYLPGCLLCNTTISCDNCSDTTLYERYQYDGVNYNCRCKNLKYLVTGKCLSYPGCLVANQYVTGEFCQQCDTLNNFEKNLADNSSCVCMIAYFPDPNNKSKCIDNCGDGRTPASPPGANGSQVICDDGNTVSGDGCSSTCRQQFGYLCHVQIPGGKSKCGEIQQINITYLYAEKNLISNSATIVFALLPPQNFLNADAFDKSVYASMKGSIKITFDPVNSLILITVDYSQSLEGNTYLFDFSFTDLKISTPDIHKQIQLNGRNAKLVIGQGNQQVVIIKYVALAVSAFALVLALVVAFLGQKMMGIQLILPVQAAYFTIVTFPRSLLSPISALWSMKFSNGFNSIQTFDLTTNHMLDSRITLLQYSGQYLLNYNIMYSLLGLVIVIFAIIIIRVSWLQRQQSRLQEQLKKLEDEEKGGKEQGWKKTKKEKTKQQQQDKEDREKSTDNDQNSTDKQTKEGATQKDGVGDQQKMQEELQDARESIRNWKSFMYMIFDRFFAIFIITAMMQIIFCFYIQLSNLTYTNHVFNDSLNAGFFFLTYGTIITGLYAIVYDYKTDKFITFNCNKGKYAIFYLALYLGFIIVLGALYQTEIALYTVAVFPVAAIILIPYQAPYGLRRFDLQTIIAMICQFPLLTTVAISFILNFQKNNMTEQNSLILAYIIIGNVGLSIILTIGRMIKYIDCKKISFIELTDRKKDGKHDKNKKKNKILVIDQLDLAKNNWEQCSQDSVRSVIHARNQTEQKQQFSIQKQNQQAYEAIAKRNQPKPLDKDKTEANNQQQEDDEEIDELEKIKIKLRKDLKHKKMVGKVK